VTQLPAGCALTIALNEPGTVRLGFDNWQRVQQLPTTANSLGLHTVAIDGAPLHAGQVLDFTFARGEQWVGRDFHVHVVDPAVPPG
jgi:hypothetical protein